MPSTYSPNLAIELIATGEQAGTWSVTTNTNLGTLIEQSISGYVTQAITDGSGANTTITIPDGATGVARNMFIEMTGALTFSTTSLIVPANKKLYFIFNNTSGGFAVTVKVSGQTGVLVPNGKKVILTSNGTDIVEAANQVVGAFGVGGTATMAAINASGVLALTIGTTNNIQNGADDALIVGASRTRASIVGNLDVQSNTAFAADLGGQIAFGGRAVTSSTASYNFASIAGRKINGTSADLSGYLELSVHDNVAGARVGLKIDNALAVTIPGTLGVTTRINAGNNAQTTYPLEVGGTNGNGIRYRDSTNTVDVFAGAFNSRGIVGTITNHAVDLYANNTPFLSSTAAGAVTIPGSLGVTGTSTMAAINASGVLTVGASNPAINAATFDGTNANGTVIKIKNSTVDNSHFGSWKALIGTGNITDTVVLGKGKLGLASNDGYIGLELSAAVVPAVTIPGTLGVTGLTTLTGGASYGSNTTWASDNTFNIGAVGANRPANIYVGTTGQFGGFVRSTATSNTVGTPTFYLSASMIREGADASFNVDTFDGAAYQNRLKIVGATGAVTIQTLTVGLGAGAVATNTVLGYQALQANTTGTLAIAVGYQAGYSNTTGEIVALGYQALYSNTTGANNAAFGRFRPLYSNTTGSDNSAFGDRPLYSNTTGSYNTALGSNALYSNTTASNNTAVGYQAVYYNTTGIQNTGIGAYTAGAFTSAGAINNITAVGYAALAKTTGADNTAVGRLASYENTSGANNVAIGAESLRSNTTASYNTAVGYQAGYANTTGAANTYVGYKAGSATTGNYSTAVGCFAGYLATGGGNTVVGYAAGASITTGTDNTFVGSSASSTGAGDVITTGSKNTIIGRYNGNQGGLDIRTASNYIVLSDGDGDPVIFGGSGLGYIDGRYFSSASTITTSVNLNNVYKPGMYRIDSGVTNAPTGDYYSLVVFGNGSNVTAQIANQLATTTTYVRSFNTSWTAWARLDT